MLSEMAKFKDGKPYFSARELQEALGYTWQKWERLLVNVVETFQQAGHDYKREFIKVDLKRNVGVAGVRVVDDYQLSPFAVSLLVMFVQSNRPEAMTLRLEIAQMAGQCMTNLQQA